MNASSKPIEHVPGQLDIYDVLEEMGVDPDMPRTGEGAMNDQPSEPIRAADVDPRTELSEEELQAQKLRDEVAGRLARRAVLRRKGVIGSLDPIDIERNLKKRDDEQMADFRRRKNK